MFLYLAASSQHRNIFRCDNSKPVRKPIAPTSLYILPVRKATAQQQQQEHEHGIKNFDNCSALAGVLDGFFVTNKNMDIVTSSYCKVHADVNSALFAPSSHSNNLATQLISKNLYPSIFFTTMCTALISYSAQDADHRRYRAS